jgi:hypothetical protein
MGEESAGLEGKGLKGQMRYRRERGEWGKRSAVLGERVETLERKEPTGGSGWPVTERDRAGSGLFRGCWAGSDPGCGPVGC